MAAPVSLGSDRGGVGVVGAALGGALIGLVLLGARLGRVRKARAPVVST